MPEKKEISSITVESSDTETEHTECPYGHTPNAITRKAIEDTQKGKGLVRCKDAKDLFEKLEI